MGPGRSSLPRTVALIDAVSRPLFISWLMFLYFILGSLVILALSAYQLQFSIQSSQSTDLKPVTLWSVLQTHKEWELVNAIIDDLNNSLTEKNKIVSKLRVEQQETRGRRIELLRSCANKISGFHRKYATEFFVYVARKEECSNEYFNIVLVSARKQITDSPNNSRFKDDEKVVSEAIDEYLDILIKEESLNTKVQALDGEIDGDGKKIKIEKENVSKILNMGTQDGNAILGDFLNSLSYLGSIGEVHFFGLGMPDFSRMPPDMLTLILVLAMGALGGTIHLTRLYFYGGGGASGQGPVNLNPSYYLFRPLLGAITALSIYILVKSGVLVISAPTPGNEDTQISPYFISFLGIVSGLLAEQALETIQSAGSRWFASSNRAELARWGHRLGYALGHPENDDGAHLSAEERKKIDDLCTILGIGEAEIMDWVRELKPVPEQYQRMIAAFLNIPERELFTDIPPTAGARV